MFDLVGFDNEIDNLINKFKSRNLHSSIILYGPKGVGKKLFINKFIEKILYHIFDEKKYLHNLNLYKNNTHPSIKIIEKLIDQKTKKLKSFITIDQIRNLKKFVNESSVIEGLSKFIIIDSVDDLNLNSANSLLKSLEEPKNNTYIFLISHQLSSLLPTLRSRCLKIKLNKHDFNNFEKILKKQIDNISNEEIKFYYDLTYGSPGNAISLYDDNFFNLIEITIKSIYSKKIDTNCIELLDLISKLDNEKFKSYLFILKSILITINKLKISDLQSNNYLYQYYNLLKNLSNSLSKQNIIDRFDFLSNNESDLYTYNLDKRLFMLKFLNG